jgi:hypothetical protein
MNEPLIKRYLLGELPVAEQRRLEEQLFSDAEAFERLAAVEEDLIDDYVCGDLSQKQRERFERHFLISPERRERLALAKTLVATVSEEEQPEAVAATEPAAPWWEPIVAFFKFENSGLRLAMVTACLAVLMFYGARETLQNGDLRRQIFQLQRAQESAKQNAEREISQAKTRNAQLQEELATFRQQSVQREQGLLALLEPPSQVLTAPTRTRGGTQPEPPRNLQVTRGSLLVKLQLEFNKATTFKIYRAELKPSAGGETIWSQSRLPARTTSKANVVEVMLPASIFASAEETVPEYKLTLSGADLEDEDFQTVEFYTFRVVQK